jgi:hypothetical protein
VLFEHGLIPRRKSSNRLSVLVFLLATAYGVMAFTLMQQGNVIQSQRYLIEQLMDDSQKLTTLKAQEAQRNRAAQAAKEKAGAPQSSEKKSKSFKPKRQLEMPPMQAVDKADARRSPVKI